MLRSRKTRHFTSWIPFSTHGCCPNPGCHCRLCGGLIKSHTCIYCIIGFPFRHSTSYYYITLKNREVFSATQKAPPVPLNVLGMAQLATTTTTMQSEVRSHAIPVTNTYISNLDDRIPVHVFHICLFVIRHGPPSTPTKDSFPETSQLTRLHQIDLRATRLLSSSMFHLEDLPHTLSVVLSRNFPGMKHHKRIL